MNKEPEETPVVEISATETQKTSGETDMTQLSVAVPEEKKPSLESNASGDNFFVTPNDSQSDTQGDTQPEKSDEPTDTSAHANHKEVPPLSVTAHANHEEVPPLSVTSLAPPTFSSRLYNILACAPLLTLTLIYLAQTFFLVDVRELWYSDEVRHADVLQYMLNTGDWFILHLNGQFYPDKPPLYFWFLSGLYHFILYFDAQLAPIISENFGIHIKLAHEGRMIQQVMSLGASLSGLLFLWASYGFARLVARFDKRLAFAVGLILMGSLYFLATTHYARMDLLFATLIIVSQIFFFAAAQRQSSLLLMLIAFVFMALACLCKGPAGALPLLTLPLYLLWQGRLGRLLRQDFWIGLLLCCLLIGGWIFILIEHFGFDFIYSNLIDRQVIQRAVDAWHHSRPWYEYLWMLPLIWLPFSFLLPVLPWGRVLNPVYVFKRLREPSQQGVCYAVIFFFSGFIALSLVSTKIHIYLLPLLAPLAVLTARTALGLDEKRSRYFKIVLACFATLMAVAFAAPLVLPLFLSMNVRILGTVIASGIALIFAAFFWGALNGRRPEGILLFWAILCCLLMQPIGIVSAPSLDAILSPRTQALLLKTYAEQGYYPISYKVYPGIYSFYFGAPVVELEKPEELEKALGAHEKVIMAIRLKDWDKRDQGLFADWQEIQRQRLAEQEAVLLVAKGVSRGVDKDGEIAPHSVHEPSPAQGSESAPTPQPVSPPAAAPSHNEGATPNPTEKIPEQHATPDNNIKNDKILEEKTPAPPHQEQDQPHDNIPKENIPDDSTASDNNETAEEPHLKTSHN